MQCFDTLACLFFVYAKSIQDARSVKIHDMVLYLIIFCLAATCFSVFDYMSFDVLPRSGNSFTTPW